MDMKEEYTQGYNVLLYNQGFGKFGPMEQCDTGEWVKWDDIEPFLRTAELRVQTAMETEKELSDEIEYLRKQVGSWKEDCFRELDINHEMQKRLDNWRAAAIGLAVGVAVALAMLIIRVGV